MITKQAKSALVDPAIIKETFTLRSLIFRRLERLHPATECDVSISDGKVTIIFTLSDGEVWPTV
jgi:hypothetical protein